MPERELQAGSTIQFNEDGLVPGVVQDWRDGTVLMVGFLNLQALEETLQTRYVHFWSRSRKTLWRKGETSGHYLMVKQVFVDCDLDTILIKAEPVGPTCHTGNPSCFFQEIDSSQVISHTEPTHSHGGIVNRLYEMALERKHHPRSDSYISSLMTGGQDRILKKIIEEAGEVLLACKNDHQAEIVYEVADLLFHTIVMLGYCEISPEAIYQELGSRFGQSGMKKKKDLSGPP